MHTIDGLGFFAASLVLATFSAKSMTSLRLLAIASNIAFVAYASVAHLWPILALHMIMLPLNLARLREVLGTAPAAVTLRSRELRRPLLD